jgi:hypothetical protein
MNVKCFVAVLGGAVLLAGCVGTVGGGKTAGMPFVKDKVEGRYERPLEQVYDSARDVLSTSGSLVNETTLHTETNLVKTIQARVETRTVWVRVSPVDEKVTSVIVQARTSGGGSDINLAHDVEKQIALRLVTK